MPKKFEDFDNPRQKAIDGMKNSISETLWNKNLNFLKELRAEISNHPVSKHPAIQLLNDGLIDKETLKHIHLEYRHAIVQVFTDALLMAQFQTKQLEPRLLSGSKMYPRFLLNLNILDEFGFRPAVDKDGYYSGNPQYAHYPLFEDVLDDFELSQSERNNYQPSIIAQQVRNYLERSFDRYHAVSALLATMYTAYHMMQLLKLQMMIMKMIYGLYSLKHASNQITQQFVKSVWNTVIYGSNFGMSKLQLINMKLSENWLSFRSRSFLNSI